MKESNVHLVKLLYPGSTGPTRVYWIRKLCCGHEMEMTYEQIVARRRRKTNQCCMCRNHSKEQYDGQLARAKENARKTTTDADIPPHGIVGPRRDGDSGTIWLEDYRLRPGPWRKHAMPGFGNPNRWAIEK